jgi:hypothetical protein
MPYGNISSRGEEVRLSTQIYPRTINMALAKIRQFSSFGALSIVKRPNERKESQLAAKYPKIVFNLLTNGTDLQGLSNTRINPGVVAKIWTQVHIPPI